MNVRSGDRAEAEYQRAKQFENEGQIEEALAIYRKLANAGHASGYFGLGSYARLVSDMEQLAINLTRLEALCAEGNIHACFYCYLGYRSGWGQLGYQQDNTMGSKYLLRAAELGDTYSQYALALEHFGGSNGQVKDESLYIHWIEKAIEGGSEDAVYEHVKFLLDKRRPVPAALISDLEILAKEWPTAAKLLTRVQRQNVK